MAAVHVQAVVGGDGTLTVRGLPSLAGHRVDVVVRDADTERQKPRIYPLRGCPLRYEKPFEAVAEDEWEVTR